MPVGTRNKTLIPTLALDFSKPSTLINPRNGFGQNLRVFENLLTQIPGNAQFGDENSTNPTLHLARFQDSDGVLFAVRLDKAKTEFYKQSNATWTDITKSGTDWTTVEATDYYSAVMYLSKDVLLLTNGLDVLQQYTGSTNLCTDVSGSPPKAKFVGVLGDYVIMANITDDGTGNKKPRRVQWPDTGDHTKWSTGNAGSIDLIDGKSPITFGGNLNEFYIISTEEELYVGRLVDTDDVLFFGSPQVTGVGILNNNCGVTHNGVLYFLGVDGRIYGFNGFRLDPLSDEIMEQIRPNINEDRLVTNHARKMIRYREIWFYITLSGNSWPTVVYKFNYETGAIRFDTCNNVTATESFRDTSGQVTIDGLGSGAIDDLVGRIDSFGGGTGFEFELIGKSDGKVFKYDENTLNDNGTAIDEQFVSMDFNGDSDEEYKRWLMLEFWMKGSGDMTLSYSIDFGETWTDIDSDGATKTVFTLTDTMKKYCAYFDTVSEYIRFRFRNNNTGEFFTLKQFTTYHNMREFSCL